MIYPYTDDILCHCHFDAFSVCFVLFFFLSTECGRDLFFYNHISYVIGCHYGSPHVGFLELLLGSKTVLRNGQALGGDR